jgi:uncharacterized protein
LAYRDIRFVYDEPAMIAKSGRSEYLVIADLHIGMEIRLSKRGVHLFNATDRMAERVIRIMRDFSLRNLIILGDVKDSILYPERAEIGLLKNFFSQIADFNVSIVGGNHDAHLGEIINRDVQKELVVGKFGFIHGNRNPTEKMMMLDYIVSAHDHIAVSIREKSGVVYEQKAWALYKLNRKGAKTSYENFNGRIRLISMPAFNDLIMGTSIDRSSKNMLNPLISNNVFDYKSVEVRNLAGQRISLA